MKMLNYLRSTVAAGCLLGLSQLATAGIISLEPNPAFGNVGGMITVDLVWTGGVGDYIGDYDVDIAYDASIVTASVVAHDLDTGLDSLGSGIYGEVFGAGSLNLFGISLDPVFGLPGDLESNQDALGNMFRLATITFDGLAEGATDLILSANAIGDQDGLASDSSLANGQICVGAAGAVPACPEPPVGVPEPASIGLLLLGLGLLGRRQLMA